MSGGEVEQLNAFSEGVDDEAEAQLLSQGQSASTFAIWCGGL